MVKLYSSVTIILANLPPKAFKADICPSSSGLERSSVASWVLAERARTPYMWTCKVYGVPCTHTRSSHSLPEGKRLSYSENVREPTVSVGGGSCMLRCEKGKEFNDCPVLYADHQSASRLSEENLTGTESFEPLLYKGRGNENMATS